MESYTYSLPSTGMPYAEVYLNSKAVDMIG
jgi:hypothetical protein